MAPVGELAALATAFCWAGSALAFEAAGRRIGSMAVNLLRMPVAIAALAAVGLWTRGLALPTDAPADAWLWLSVSGLIGFVLGDLCLFRALVVIGPRLSSLIMSLAPVFTALFGWLALGETLAWAQWLGMTMVIGGIGWAIADQVPQGNRPPPSARGVLLALGGALGQAGGLVAAKVGMHDYSDPFAATQVRIIAAVVGFVVIFTVVGWWRKVRAALGEGKALVQVSAGALFGPFIGVALSLLAVQRTETGVAAAIMATTPIVLIPIVVVFYREKVGLGGVLGAVVAVSGVALLFAS
ncbi:MAG: DMT family transporter [Deltaproteobacteria bacterium]|nr:DMT family transporter [Deltaproteobacteria bacterium]